MQMVLAALIAVVMIFTLESDANAAKAHPVPYLLGTLFMWGLITHYHWTRYTREGRSSSRIYAVLWGLHFVFAIGLLFAFGWHAFFS